MIALKKHGKADEDTRFQGTLLGRESDAQPVTIAGGREGSLAEWTDRFKAKSRSEAVEEGPSPLDSSLSSAPVSPNVDGEQEQEQVEAGAMEAVETASTPMTQA